MLDAISGQLGRLKLNNMDLEIDSFRLTINPVNANITSNKSGGSVERFPVVQDWSLHCKCHLPGVGMDGLTVIKEGLDFVTDIEVTADDFVTYRSDVGVVESAVMDNDTVDVARWELTINAAKPMRWVK